MHPLSTIPLLDTDAETYHSNLNPNDTSARPGLNSTSPPSSSSSPSLSTSSLSTGAKVGIGIGAVVGALALLGLVWLYVRRRRHHTSLQQHMPYDGSGSAPPHELDPKSTGVRHEKDGRQMEEPPVELEGQHTF
jgi:MYXO-CTERM domain-containing protein